MGICFHALLLWMSSPKVASAATQDGNEVLIKLRLLNLCAGLLLVILISTGGARGADGSKTPQPPKVIHVVYSDDMKNDFLECG